MQSCLTNSGHNTNQSPCHHPHEEQDCSSSAKFSFCFLHCLVWHRSVQAKLLATHWHDGATQSLLHEQDRNSSTACGPVGTSNQPMESCKSPSWSAQDHPFSTLQALPSYSTLVVSLRESEHGGYCQDSMPFFAQNSAYLISLMLEILELELYIWHCTFLQCFIQLWSHRPVFPNLLKGLTEVLILLKQF